MSLMNAGVPYMPSMPRVCCAGGAKVRQQLPNAAPSRPFHNWTLPLVQNQHCQRLQRPGPKLRCSESRQQTQCVHVCRAPDRGHGGVLLDAVAAAAGVVPVWRRGNERTGKRPGPQPLHSLHGSVKSTIKACHLFAQRNLSQPSTTANLFVSPGWRVLCV